MFLELIAAVFAGAAAGGVVLLANRLSGGRLPRWLMPVAAGIAMIAFTIAMEYSWFDRTASALPEGIVVTQSHESSAFWRPWTYLAPITNRFVAVETAAVRINDSVPHQRMADLIFFGRWQPPRYVPMVIDCAARRGAPLLDNVTFDDTGAVERAEWAPIPDEDGTYDRICKEIRP